MVKGGENHSRESELMCTQITKAKPGNPESVNKSKEKAQGQRQYIQTTVSCQW